MSDLRDYILSKLQEQLGKAERNPAGQKAVADWKMKRRVGREGSPVRVGQSDTGEHASIAAEKKAGKLTGKLLSRGPKGLGQTKGGMRGWSNVQQGHSADARQDASTDLRTQLAYVLANKLEEYRGEKFGYEPGEAPARGEKNPVKTAVGDALSKMRYGTKKPAEVEAGVIKDPGTRGGISTETRKKLGKLSKTPRWKKIEGSPGMPKLPSRKKEESTNLKDRMVDILMEMRGDQYKKHNPRSVYATGERPIPKRKSKDAEILGRSLQVDKTFQSGKPATPAAKEKLSGYFNYRPDVAQSLGVRSAMDHDDGGEEPRSGSYFRNRNNGLSER